MTYVPEQSQYCQGAAEATKNHTAKMASHTLFRSAVLIAVCLALLLSDVAGSNKHTKKLAQDLLSDVAGSNSSSTRQYTFDSHLPARLQWLPNEYVHSTPHIMNILLHNSNVAQSHFLFFPTGSLIYRGYCGEVSLIMACLRLGGCYYSQYDARQISTTVDSQVSKFYLVGVNDQHASKLLRLTFEEFDNANPVTDPKRYLSWVKKMTRAGAAVTITVFMNEYMFYGRTDKTSGEADYDHIVSVSRIESDYDDDLYHDDDLVTMEDHGLYAPGHNPIYLFTYSMRDFIGTREHANSQTAGNVYSIPECDSGNFGIAHFGIIDADGDTLPILLETNVNYESPHIRNKSEDRPDSMEIVLTVTVSGLEDGVQYKLYKYNDETLVPSSAFNANSAKVAISTLDITSSTGSYKLTETIQSSDKVIYRCVRADAK